MKKMMFAVFGLMLATDAFARFWTDSQTGIEWFYFLCEGEVEIGYNNPRRPAISVATTGNLVVPSILDGLPVTRISRGAFAGCAGLTSITMPEGVTYIGPEAFGGCSGLTSLTIPKGVTKIRSRTFYGCSELTSITIPEGVTSIDNEAFSGCSDLTSITIPEGVTKIRNGTFYGCSELTTLNIPEGVTSIGSDAFSGCSGLGEGVVVVDRCVLTVNGMCPSTVVFPLGTRLIADGVFARCRDLTAVTIPDGVTSIGRQAFFDCSGLTSVTIPESVTSIGKSAFDGCDGLGEGLVISGQCVLTVNGEWPSEVVVPNGVRLMANGVFSGCVGLTSITIPESVTSIGDDTFYCCSDLTSITIPEGVTNIGYSAFGYCSGLTSITIPGSVSSIGTLAFSGCVGLTSITIPEGVTCVGDGAFEDCSSLTNVVIPSSVAYIGAGSFFGCCSLMSFDVDERNAVYKTHNRCLLSKDGETLICGANGDVTIPENVTIIECGAFFSYGGLTSVNIPETVASIGDEAFKYCSGLTSITIPESVTNIGVYAFGWCDGLTNATISSSNVRESAFCGCYGLTDVTLSEGVASIGMEAFQCCESLTSVVIPQSVTNVDSCAFDGCTGLVSVLIRDGAMRIDDAVFQGCDNLRVVKFEGAPPVGLADAEINQDAAIFYNIAHEDEWIPVIEECGFSNATPYDPSSLPDGGPYCETVDGIEWTFEVTNDMAVVKGIPKGVVGSVVVPSSLGGRTVKKIADNAFGGCKEMTSVTISSGVSDIGTGAFYGCQKLLDVYFEGDGVSSVAGDAFAHCNWDLVFHVPNGWIGRSNSFFGHAVVRDGASEALKVNLTVTNVVIQYVLNSVLPNIAAPVMDIGFVTTITEVRSSGAVSVPSEWRNNYPTFATKFGSDFGKALTMKSGKKDGAGNDMLVWQDFVAGTDPTNPEDKFTASIAFVDGVPVVSYTPELPKEQSALRTYKTFGKMQLQESEWTDITNLDGEKMKSYNFFKVTVEMK